MATFVGVFIDTDRPIASVIPQISAMLGTDCVVEHSDGGNVYSFFLLGLDIAAWDDHGLVPDQGIDFPRYSIQLDIGPLLGEMYRDALARAIALYLGSRVNRQLGYPTIVVENLQRVLCRFEGPG
jgi:hypothetical protein